MKERSGHITIADVATRAEVSPASVSRYLNGSTGNLSERTAERIAQAIRDLGYRPNAWARSIRTRRSGLIAAVVADLNNPYAPGVLEGIEAVINRHGYSLLIASAQNDASHESVIVERLLNQRIEGILLQPSADRLTAPLSEVLDEHIPLVLIDRQIRDAATIDMVGLDNAGAIRTALTHLQQAGYRKILYVTDPPESVSSRLEREQAVLAGQSQWTAVQIYTRQGPDPKPLLETIQAMLSHPPHAPTALLCSNGVTALFTVKAIGIGNLKVPAALGLMTIDDPEWAPFVYGGITSLAQPTFELGSRAARRLMDKLHDQEGLAPTIIRLSGSLIPRSSTTTVSAKREE
ncbi:MAG: LacI family DNA-binding transcriptional regulator [Thermaerobacter sp.]|nr:LacI family DNA-binding transcriptional regulator [Thermaerobacter sp.]